MVKNIMLLSVSLVLTFCLVEAAVRAMGLRGEVGWNLHDIIHVDDKILNFRLRPSSTSYSGDVAYRLNSRGFRDVEHDFAKKESVFRILVLGDSVAFGYKVQFQDTFARQLEAQTRLIRPNTPVEVINIAMPGLNTYQEAYLLIEEGIRYNPDLIVVAYSLNDADTGVSFVEKEKSCRIQLIDLPLPCEVKTLMKSSAALYLVKDRIDHLLWRWNIGDKDDPLSSIKADFFGKLYNHGSKWQDNVVQGFQMLEDVTNKFNIPTVVLVFPVLYDFERYEWKWIHKKLDREVEAHQFFFIDLLESYREHPVKDLRVERGDFVHPGAMGYKVAASAVRAFIEKTPKLFRKPYQ